MKHNKFNKFKRSISQKFYCSYYAPNTQGYWSYHYSGGDIDKDMNTKQMLSHLSMSWSKSKPYFITPERIWFYIWFMSVSGKSDNCKSVSGNTSWWRSLNRFSVSGSMNDSYSRSGSFH